MIPIYISSHGFGHMTRCLAIIEQILETTDKEVYIASGETQVQFAMAYLARFSVRVTYNAILTDVGLVNEDGSLAVNKDALTEELTSYIYNFDKVVKNEVDFLKSKDVNCVLTDISCIGIDVAKHLGVSSIGVTNFTWLEQYSFLGLDQTILDFFESKYSMMDHVLLYDLATDEFIKFITKHNINVLDKIGLVTRPIDLQKIRHLKLRYEKPVFVSFGKSTSMETLHINYDGTIISTMGTHVEVNENGRHIELMHSTLDTQNFIAASELVISKAGWGTIAEAIVAGVPLVLVEREGVLEDMHHIELLKKENLCISVKEKDLKHIDINQLRIDVMKLKKDKKRNNTVNVVKAILGV